MTQSTGTMYLPTLSALTIWNEEITGQLSDGMWENTRPREHYKFWQRLDVVHESQCTPHVRKSDVNYSCWCVKNNYNLTALISHELVCERMIASVQDSLYTVKNLRIDLLSIKTAMRSCSL